MNTNACTKREFGKTKNADTAYGTSLQKSTGSQQLTQFELCKLIYTSGLFNKIKLAPTSKLVLVALANHYNPRNPEMFPSQEYLAGQLGISLNSVKNAVKELRQKSLILSELKGSNHYRFSNIFFELINFVPSETKICADDGPKFVLHEQKHEHEINSNKSENYKNSLQRSPFGQNFYKQKTTDRIEATRRLIKETFDIKPLSPMDDYETAKNWLAELSENELKHAFIRERVEKVKKLWGLT